MISAMFFFALEDSMMKFAFDHLPITQVVLLFGLGGAVFYAGMALRKGQSLFPPEVLSKAMIIRFFFESVGRVFFVLALIYAPLSSITIIMQAAPIVVLAAAALVLGEKVGWRRWVAVGIGLIGVGIIVGPGSSSFAASSILAIFGMLGFALRDVASRAAPKTISNELLGLYGFTAVIAGAGMLTLWQSEPYVIPTATGGLFMIACIVAGVLAYICLMKAMRTGEVTFVSPFRFSRLISGIFCSMVFFGESLSTNMIIGSIFIVAAGLFIFWRGRQVETE